MKDDRNILSFINKFPLVIILVLYVLSNFLMLFNDGVYWDDWCIYNMSYLGIKDIYEGVGLKFMTSITYYLQNLSCNPSILYHFLTFIFELLGIILFYKIASYILSDKAKVFWLTAFFAVIPYNEAKILMVILPYTIGFFLFLLATLFFMLFIKKSVFIYRLLSLGFYFLSFMFLNSSLILMIGFVIFMTISPNDLRNSKLVIKSMYQRLLSWTDFMLLPFLFLVFRYVFLSPTGIYKAQGYNQISFFSIVRFPVNLISAVNNNLFGLVYEIFGMLYSSLFLFLLFIIIAIFLVFFLGNKLITFDRLDANLSKKWLLAGIYFSFFCSFAYLIIDKTPSFSGYDTRHQILLRISTPILIIWFVGIFKSNMQKYILIVLLSFFIVTTTKHNIQYLSSWFKQIAIERKFEYSKEIKENKNFLVLDNTIQLNETERNYEFYCFTGMSKKVFKDQTRFIATADEAEFLRNNKNFDLFIKNLNYNMINYNLYTNPNNYYVIIRFGKKQMTDKDVVFLLIDKYFSKEKFNSKISSILDFDCVLK